MKIALLMMQKNEVDLLEPWLAYHAHVFGAENLYLWDNGSTDATVRTTLSNWASKLGSLDENHSTGLDFRRKGILLGNKIKDLDSTGAYDFYIPIDCDEFLVALDESSVVSSSLSAIEAELGRHVAVKKALGIQTAFYNLPGREDYYWKSGYKKTFFVRGTFKDMDHGFHEGRSAIEPGVEITNLAFMHFHHKPHAQIQEHSKNKLMPYYDLSDEKLIEGLYETNRLVRFMLDSEAIYLDRFKSMPSIYAPSFRNFLAENRIARASWM
jgi:hypothetical protein